jgi:opacity protein-like surface antigen
MKKIVSVFALFASMIASASVQAAGPFYGGVSLGSTSLPTTSTTAIGFMGGYKLDRSQTSFMRDLGTMSIEAHYTMLGEDAYSTGFAGFGTMSYKVKYASMGVDAVALFPIKSVQNVSAFAKLGFANTSASTSCSGTGFYAGVGCTAVGSASGLVWGVGAQYDVDRQIAVRAGYQTYASNVTTLYVAALYNF